MKKIILPIISFLVILILVKYSYAQNSQTSPDCLEQRHNAEYQCGQIHKACVEGCSGPKIDKCIGACFDEQYKCDDAAKVEYNKCFNEQNPDRSKEPATNQPTPSPETKSGNAINDWIIENIGVYEPIINTIEDTPLQERKPNIEQDNSDSGAPKVAESKLIPGTRISNYGKGIMIEISQGGWIYIPPSGEVIYGTDEWRRFFDIMMGTVEVETNDDATYIKTPNAVIKTKGTHYWVSYDPDKKETILGVYEGEVEVQTKDGKTANVKSDGDKPGIAVVSQKLSIIKVFTTLGIIAMVVSAIIWFIRRKTTKKQR